MSFSDNLENSLKNLESHDERDAAGGAQSQQRRHAQRATVLASAPYAEKLRSGKYTSGLMTHATRIGHGLHHLGHGAHLSRTSSANALREAFVPTAAHDNTRGGTLTLGGLPSK